MASWVYCLFVFDLLFISNGGADFGMRNSDSYVFYTQSQYHYEPSCKKTFYLEVTWTCKNYKKTANLLHEGSKHLPHAGSKFNLQALFTASGPYIVEWDNSEVCRGPKSVNMSSHAHTMLKQADGSYRYLLNITFKDTVRIEEIRINVNTMKEGKKTILWNVHVNKPCQHYMLAAMLETYFGVKNCYVKKGEMFVNLPLTDLMVKYVGTSFFYGDYIFKVVVTSKTANLCCIVFDPKFKKKTKKPS